MLARLTHLRREYEKEASQSCGYQRIYPLEAEDCDGDADRAAEQMELYASYLDIAVRHALPCPSPMLPTPPTYILTLYLTLALYLAPSP